MIPARRVIAYISILLCLSSCSEIKNLFESLKGMKDIEFQLDGISNVNLSEIKISSGFKLTDLTTVDVIKLTRNAAEKRLPISFILLINAKNPNPREGSSISVNAQITEFPFDLYLNNQIAFSGNISSPVIVPENGGRSLIPLQISFDLFNLFKDGNYKSFTNLAANLAGFNLEKVDLMVKAQPTIKTKLGDLSPGEITIVKEKI